MYKELIDHRLTRDKEQVTLELKWVFGYESKKLLDSFHYHCNPHNKDQEVLIYTSNHIIIVYYFVSKR
jgi:hypothetical protein